MENTYKKLSKTIFTIVMSLALLYACSFLCSWAFAAGTEVNDAAGTYSVEFKQKIEGNAEGITATYKLSYVGSPSQAKEMVMPNGVKGEDYIFVLPGNTSQTLTFSFPHAGAWSYKIVCTSVDYEGEAKTIEKDSLDRDLNIYVANATDGGYNYEALWTINGSKTDDPSITHTVTDIPSTSETEVTQTSDVDLAPLIAVLAAVLLGSGIYIYIMRGRKHESKK